MRLSLKNRELVICVLGVLLAVVSVGALVLHSIDRTSSSYWTIVLVAMAAIGCGLLLWLIPKVQLAQFRFEGEDGGKNRFASENEARKSLAQLLGGLAFLATFYVTWSNFSIERDKATAEAFTKAIEQLANTEMPVRVGGAYALERLVRSSPKDSSTVLSVLTETLRNQKQQGFDARTAKSPTWTPRADDDVQTIVRMLGRGRDWVGGPVGALNLTDSDLRGIEEPEDFFDKSDFGNADIRAARFRKTHLSGVSFIEAKGDVLAVPDPALAAKNEKNIDLLKTHPNPCIQAEGYSNQMRSVQFSETDLTAAHFDSGHFQGAHFAGAILVKTHFDGADLRGASFAGSDLKDAVFTGAHVEGANFVGAKNFSPSQLAAAFQDGCTQVK